MAKIKKSVSVEQEWDSISQEKCSCGGDIEISSQTLTFPDDKNRVYDIFEGKCSLCGKSHEFKFDIGSYFWNQPIDDCIIESFKESARQGNKRISSQAEELLSKEIENG